MRNNLIQESVGTENTDENFHEFLLKLQKRRVLLYNLFDTDLTANNQLCYQIKSRFIPKLSINLFHGATLCQ
ncbi:MAG: hypothetical protein K9G65_03175 [Rickettsiaceae bacterium]|nr:hypothetical protein [Rickettsiaceae bacterium]